MQNLHTLFVSFIRNINASPYSDAELIQRYKDSNDLNELSFLYQRYMDLVYGVCLKYLKDTDLAQDAVMNIFEELVLKLLAHEVSNFRSWLYALSRNHCLMYLRTAKKTITTDIKDSLMQSEDPVHLNGVMEKEENLEKLKSCLEALSREQKHCVELFYLQNKCYNEIVEMTGHEWNQVRSYIQNGRRNLKICMEKK